MSEFVSYKNATNAQDFWVEAPSKKVFNPPPNIVYAPIPSIRVEQKPCPYCERKSPRPLLDNVDNGGLRVTVDAEEAVLVVEDPEAELEYRPEIDFCPRCGRKLWKPKKKGLDSFF